MFCLTWKKNKKINQRIRQELAWPAKWRGVRRDQKFNIFYDKTGTAERHQDMIRFDKPILGRCYSLKVAFFDMYFLLGKYYTPHDILRDLWEYRDSQPPASGADQIT